MSNLAINQAKQFNVVFTHKTGIEVEKIQFEFSDERAFLAICEDTDLQIPDDMISNFIIDYSDFDFSIYNEVKIYNIIPL